MKSGFVILVGRSNVGKSTLLNTLIGTKVAATSFRAQMTRHVIHGVLNQPEGQAVFVDTPGIFQDHKDALTAKLTNKVKDALTGIDLIIYVVDPTREIGDEEKRVYGMIRHLEQPKILVINKSDLPPQERKYQEQYEAWADDFTSIFRLSALKNRHVQPLRDRVIEMLPEGGELYEGGQLTNVTQNFFVEELIREKMFSVLEKEVPYSVTVEVDRMEQRTAKNAGEIFEIHARILTDADRYKRMIIGKGGTKIKEIGQMARRELETALNTKVFLDLEVEVDPHWVERV